MLSIPAETKRPVSVSEKGFNDHFSALAAAYAAGRPTYPTELYDWIARKAPARDRLWDCATGNGQAAAGLADHFLEIHATDASAEQIGQAIAHPRIAYSVQEAEHTTFDDDFFDVVTVAQAMHWFRVAEFGAEASRVLRPGGLLVAWAYGFFRVLPEIDAIMQREFFEPIQPYWPAGAEMAWSGYESVEFALAPVCAPQLPLICRWRLPQLRAYLESWSALRYYTQDQGPGLLDRALEQVSVLWGDSAQARPVSMDLRIRAWCNEAGGG
jgi:SAM-dependent methyltransferase